MMFIQARVRGVQHYAVGNIYKVDLLLSNQTTLVQNKHIKCLSFISFNLMESNKKTLYIGGLADDVDVKLLKTVFSPFGDIVDVNLPLDHKTQKHQGFAFIEYQLPEDATDALDNLDYGEILGKTIRVSFAKPLKNKENLNRAIWANDEYLKQRQED